MRKKLFCKTITRTLGMATLASTPIASATVTDYDWDGLFTFLDPTGVALFNTSQNNGSTGNNFQDFVSGTLAFDDVTGAGIATMASFDWGDGITPMEATSFTLQTVGDGLGGSGSLIVSNLVLNWNGNNGIPISMVFDASGFLAGELTTGGPQGAVPASDGTFINYPVGDGGYLNTGPVPMATTYWNTTNAIGCGPNDGTCDFNGASGKLPLIVDTAANLNDFDLTTPTYSDLANEGIGGSPMQAGPFPGFNFNLDITDLTIADPDVGGSIAALDVGPEIPVPAAVWLFGSGLLGLFGVAYRKKAEV